MSAERGLDLERIHAALRRGRAVFRRNPFVLGVEHVVGEGEALRVHFLGMMLAEQIDGIPMMIAFGMGLDVASLVPSGLFVRASASAIYPSPRGRASSLIDPSRTRGSRGGRTSSGGDRS